MIYTFVLYSVYINKDFSEWQNLLAVILDFRYTYFFLYFNSIYKNEFRLHLKKQFTPLCKTFFHESLNISQLCIPQAFQNDTILMTDYKHIRNFSNVPNSFHLARVCVHTTLTVESFTIHKHGKLKYTSSPLISNS